MARTEGILYLDTDRVVFAQLRPSTSGKWLLSKAAFEWFDLSQATSPLGLAALAEAIRTLAKNHHLTKTLSVILPDTWVLTRRVSVPVIQPQRQASALTIEAEQAFPYALEAAAWDHHLIAADAIERHYMVAVTPLARVEGLYQVLKAEGIRVLAFLPAALLDYHLTRRMIADFPGSVLIIHLKRRCCRLTCLDEADIAIHRYPIAFPTDKMTDCRSSARQVYLETQRLQTLVAGESEQGERVSWQKILLIDPGSRDREKALLNQPWTTPVEVCRPLEDIEVGTPLDPSIVQAETFPLAELMGSVLGNADRQSIRLNLIPPAIRRQQRLRRPWLPAAAVLWTVAAVLFAVKNQNALPALQHQTQVRQHRIEALKARHTIAAEQQAEIAEMQDKLASVQALAESQYAWIDFLSELQDHLYRVGDVWLDKLHLVYPQTPEASLQYYLSGRMLDRHRPLQPISPAMERKVHQLIASLSESPFVEAIDLPKIHTDPDGILQFAFYLTPCVHKFGLNAFHRSSYSSE